MVYEVDSYIGKKIYSSLNCVRCWKVMGSKYIGCKESMD